MGLELVHDEISCMDIGPLLFFFLLYGPPLVVFCIRPSFDITLDHLYLSPFFFFLPTFVFVHRQRERAELAARDFHGSPPNGD